MRTPVQTRAPSNVSIENASIYNQQAISNSQQNVQFNDQAHVNITNTYNINIVSSQRLDDRKTVDSMTPKTKSQAGARKNVRSRLAALEVHNLTLTTVIGFCC